MHSVIDALEPFKISLTCFDGECRRTLFAALEFRECILEAICDSLKYKFATENNGAAVNNP